MTNPKGPVIQVSMPSSMWPGLKARLEQIAVLEKRSISAMCCIFLAEAVARYDGGQKGGGLPAEEDYAEPRSVVDKVSSAQENAAARVLATLNELHEDKPRASEVPLPQSGEYRPFPRKRPGKGGRSGSASGAGSG